MDREAIIDRWYAGKIRGPYPPWRNVSDINGKEEKGCPCLVSFKKKMSRLSKKLKGKTKPAPAHQASASQSPVTSGVVSPVSGSDAGGADSPHVRWGSLIQRRTVSSDEQEQTYHRSRPPTPAALDGMSEGSAKTDSISLLNLDCGDVSPKLESTEEAESLEAAQETAQSLNEMQKVEAVEELHVEDVRA